MLLSRRLTPKIILYGLAANFSLWLISHIPFVLGWTPRLIIFESAVTTLFLFWAYLFALVLNLEIASEYKDAQLLRISWLALTANAGISGIKIIIESKLFDQIWEGYSSGYFFGLIQHIAIVPANICLLIGLLAMGWSYHQIGLGFSIEKRDYLPVAGLFLLIMLTFVYREGLTQAQSPYLMGRYLQLLGLFLLALCAAASLVLHRMARQMDGGKLAIALRMLAFYTLLRGVLVLVDALRELDLPEFSGFDRIPAFIISLGWQAVPWLAALAAAYRGEMTVQAAEELKQKRAANAELASVL
ncbi:MAG: hypothetical protein J2P41_09320 [Blastocatellia bacterium]|nr:hypothetical protein [Blastocatellia bacterium]